MTEVEQLRKELLEAKEKTDAKMIAIDKIKAFKPLESGETEDGSYRRWVKMQLPRSKRIVKIIEPDGNNFWQADTEVLDILKRAIRCISTIGDGKAEQDLSKIDVGKKYELFLNASSVETAPLIDAFNWLTRELNYPEFFRETPSK